MYKNPFLETLIVPYIRCIKPEVGVMQQIEGLEEGDYFDVEVEKSTRLYRSPQRLADMLQLSSYGLRLAIWIMYNVNEDSISIRLDDLKLSGTFQCSGRQVARMRTDLLKASILAKKKENEYWINPRFFAADSRLKLYPENTVLHRIIKLSK